MKEPVRRLAGEPNRFRRPPRRVRLLGVVADREVALRSGIHFRTVIAELWRQAYHIEGSL
jgi:hypothetical protein